MEVLCPRENGWWLEREVRAKSVFLFFKIEEMRAVCVLKEMSQQRRKNQ